MDDGKIIRFPGDHATSEVPTLHREDACEQPTLFVHGEDERGKIVFLDIEWFAEEPLLTLLVRNAVAGILDLRPRPVFDRPRFRHRSVIQYLYERNVCYIEYAMLARDHRKISGHFGIAPEVAKARINELLVRGLTICLYDEGARSIGWMEDVRHLVRFIPGYLAELHPRALVGVPPEVMRVSRRI